MRYRTELMDSILTSETARRFIDFIAPVYGNGYVALWMFQAIGLSLDELTQAASGLGSQTVPQTADWSIPDWEAEYGISADPSLTDEQRRANIIMRMNFVAPANPARLEQIASAASGVPCEIIENVGKNTFAVVMRAPGGNVSNMKSVLDTAKPAHLIYVSYVSLLREAESGVNISIGGSYHKKYPDVELALLAREAEANARTTVTFTRCKHYGEIEVENEHS